IAIDYTNEHVSDDNFYTNLYPDPYSDPYSDLYTDSNIGPQDNSESSSTAARRKATEKSTENEHDFCKIFMLKKGIEKKCRANYKHDRENNNMKFHLRTKHGILGPDNLIQGSNKQQLQIDKIIRKVSSYKETIQRELKRITAE
ncbi:3429_t:CDS:2, partial [Cetraspora pellucida]